MNRVDEKLADVRTVGIAGHVRPDGDCAGSTLALYNYIKDNYPNMDVRLYLEPIPNIFKFLQRSEEIRSDYADEMQFDLFFCRDYNFLFSAGRKGYMGSEIRGIDVQCGSKESVYIPQCFGRKGCGQQIDFFLYHRGSQISQMDIADRVIIIPRHFPIVCDG